jgi:hypothetical protein
MKTVNKGVYMKKLVSALAILFTLTLITSCQNAAIANGTTGEIKAGSGSGSGWGLCKNSAYDIFDMQVWGDGAGTFEFENSSNSGRFTVLSKGGGWVGGGLVCADSSKKFDMTGVTKMTFDIRGTIDPKALCLAIQNNGGSNATMYPSKGSIATNGGVSSLNASTWTTVTMNVTGVASDSIINAFCLIIAADWNGSFAVNDYFEIRNLDWQDASGNSVTISLK